MWKKIVLAIVAIVAVGAVAAYALTRPTPADTRYSGAYALEDGTIVLVTPREGDVLRYRLMNGESAALWPTDKGDYEGGTGWGEREPIVNRFKFTTGADGKPTGFEWQHSAAAGQAPVTRHGRALKLREQIFKFPSGDLQLRGKLILPEGEGPFPVVVNVHGSEMDSAVDYYFEPYFYAANGFASLVYDKRGTGESDGKYLANFHVLADDVLAAVHWLRSQSTIDGKQIHLAGFSQGGWIAPIAAQKDGGIRSLLIGFGVMTPVTAEDRWGYVYALQQKGFGEDVIAQADRINEVLVDIAARRLNRWDDLGRMLDEARSEPWVAAIKDSESALGWVANSKMPLWMWRVFAWWKLDAGGGPAFIEMTYDPVPTLASLDVPNLWLLGGEDSSVPTQWTVEALQKIKDAGKPVEYVVYPKADHGILTFKQEPGGERKYIGYEPGYFPKQIEWLRAHSLPRSPS